MKGFTGTPFVGSGKTLGGGHIPREELRRRARAQANEERERRKKLQARSGQRLGGSTMSGGLRNAIVQATTRRQGTSAVNDGCATGTKAGDRAAEDALLNGFKSKRDMDDADQQAIQQAMWELMQYEELRNLDQETARPQQPMPQQHTPQRPMSEGLTWDSRNGLQAAGTYSNPVHLDPPYNPPPIPSQSKPRAQAPAHEANRHSRSSSGRVKDTSNPRSTHRKPVPSQLDSQATAGASKGNSSKTWACSTCTLLNPTSASKCDACDAPRLASSSSSSRTPSRPVNTAPPGWACMTCGNFMEPQWWMCSFCRSIKTHS
jgi:hypothetical protein